MVRHKVVATVSLETHGEDKRHFPRIRLNQSARVRFPDGRLALDIVYDISPGGLRLLCNRELATVIHPTQSIINNSNHPTIVLAIDFPYPEGLPEIVVDCCIRHIKVIGEGEFLFGVEFEQFKDDGAKHFARFIDASLTPI